MGMDEKRAKEIVEENRKVYLRMNEFEHPNETAHNALAKKRVKEFCFRD